MDLVSLPCDNTRVPRVLFNHNTNNAHCIHLVTTRHPRVMYTDMSVTIDT
jgi:hypothetical protein